ncbi:MULTISPECIES: BON domain-containing protein [Legionella]|uniref:BON domain-containing protein n=1 Tax=Legionella septentrionalis TaxID=2498109 RepID=A0A3S0XG78_9GAMM|nr:MULTISPECIES: BON domain-containing protein [Legionella]MCP0913714.1 BON domain-containing protein [Legionella sp. 27cVA30]RUQ85421.1 BON domain-containing protein [Legionella septentrionalis]RUQ99335.1 BON domain-containing protein [Legionella septentrionalis]RUR09612.1 BON domain-containing protein [Legionella septentrionalis]RUR14812.1 BON domain-containing protein [Legionella septentrionalis]
MQCYRILILVCCTFLASCQVYQNQSLFTLKPNDATITTSVMDALVSNRELAPYNLHVESEDGVVHLSGYVKTIRQSDIAGEVAKKVAGVKSVENNIIVRK